MATEGQWKYFFSARKTLVFSLIFFVLQIGMSGISVQGAVMQVVFMPMAILVFLAWRDGTQSQTVLNISFRAILLGLLVFLSFVLFIKTEGVGQLGYGESLQIEGTHITPLGYKLLMTTAMETAAVAWIAAIIAAFFQVKRIPRH